MGFEKLQQRLRDFFITETSYTADKIQMARVRERALAEFVQQKPKSVFFQIFNCTWIRSATIGAIILSLFPFLGAERSAGDLSPTGLVEVVRDGKVFVATGQTPLHIGDQILVGNNSSAEIQLRKSMKAVASDRAELRIPRENALFLIKGSLDGNIASGSIETNRGKIDAETDATLNVFVSNSGETRIRPRESDIWVTAWNQKQITIAEGEELRLQTDTQMPPKIPRDLRLSSSQILAIRAKLLIARTRALNSVEAYSLRDSKKAISEFNSADRTFRSIAQVLKSSRDLQVLRRENLDLLSRETVIDRLKEREKQKDLLENAFAVDSLLSLIEKEPKQKIVLVESDLLIFNRYSLLQRIFAPQSKMLRAQGLLLQKQYIVALSQQIMNVSSSEKEIETILSQIPHSGAGRQVLQQVQLLLPTEQVMQIEKHLVQWN
jgi:hypothetical protein